MSVESSVSRVSKDSGVSFTAEMWQVVQKSHHKKPKIPSKFSWVVDGLLSGLVSTQNRTDLTYLVNSNVGYLVDLRRDGDPEVDDCPGLVTVTLRLPWSGCPDIEQVVEFLALVDLAQSENKAVAVQCSDGLGATGTMLACYLVQREALSAQEAVEKIRHLRPGSLGSRSYEVLIAEYETFRRKVPLRFSWVIKDRLCALGFPSEQEHLQYLVDHGVKYLVSLTEEVDPDTHSLPELHKIDIKMQDFGCPTLQQVHKFISVMERASSENTAVAIHCFGGRGRTGTMAACYMVHNEGLTARQALAKIRQLRPGSVETHSQEDFIKMFENTIRKMPDNFSWVVDGLLCTLAFPESRENLQYLLHNNVAYLISLTAEREPPISLCPDLELVCLKIQDFSPPTIEQVEEFLNILQKAMKRGKAVALHCSQGQGRTGTMIACYLVKFNRFNAREAIERARILRPGSVETKEQEKLVMEFEHYLRDIGYFIENC